MNVERVSIEGRGPRPHISCIEKSLACRQAVEIASNQDATALAKDADAWRRLQLDYKVRAGTGTRTLLQVQEQLHMLHAVMEQPIPAKAPLRKRRWVGRGTKAPAGARISVKRELELKRLSAEEFRNPVDHHPNRKVSKTRLKAVLLLNSCCKKMNEGGAG